MRLFILSVSLAAALVLTTTRVHAWNGVGHMTVARLAYAQLTDAQKKQFDDLLQHHPHYAVYLSKNKPNGIGMPEWVFLRAATWPDWIRDENDPDTHLPNGQNYQGMNNIYTHDHFINLPIIRPGDESFFANQHIQAPQENAVNAIARHTAVLKSATSPDDDKAISLCWVLHVVGDIHQPLHCVNFYSKDQFRHGDEGGNSFGVTVNGKKVHLHTYWDDLFGEDPTLEHRDNVTETPKLLGLVTKAAESLHGSPFQRANLTELGTGRTPDQWATESKDAAFKVAYDKGTLQGVVIPFHQPVPANAPAVPADYADKALATAQHRVALAGFRLADTLSGVLADRH